MACKIFLGKGALPPCNPQIMYFCKFTPKGPEILHIKLTKFNCPLATPKSYISVNLGKKGPEIMHV